MPIQLKRSSTAANVPASLVEGELALNHADRKAFVRGPGGAVETLDAWVGAIANLHFVIDGGGSAITTGVKGDLQIPFACQILGWSILPDQAGSAVVDVWRDTFANYPPTVADKITGTAKPTLSAAVAAQSSTLTGWNTTINAGDILRFNVDSAATVTRLTIVLKVRKV